MKNIPIYQLTYGADRAGELQIKIEVPADTHTSSSRQEAIDAGRLPDSQPSRGAMHINSSNAHCDVVFFGPLTYSPVLLGLPHGKEVTSEPAVAEGADESTLGNKWSTFLEQLLGTEECSQYEERQVNFKRIPGSCILVHLKMPDYTHCVVAVLLLLSPQVSR